MKAIRKRTRVTDGRIDLNVPASLNGKEVEVIILSPETGSPCPKIDKQEFLQFLRNGPTFSAAECLRIDEVKKEFRNWTFDEF